MHDKAQRVLGLVGLARRSGNVVAGTTATQYAISDDRAELILVAEDASTRTRRTFFELGRRERIPVASVASKVELGRATGSGPTAVCAICDGNFAMGITEILGLRDQDRN